MGQGGIKTSRNHYKLFICILTNIKKMYKVLDSNEDPKSTLYNLGIRITVCLFEMLKVLNKKQDSLEKNEIERKIDEVRAYKSYKI